MQFFLEENDAENEVLEKGWENETRISETKTYHWFFQVTFLHFCSYECKPKQKYWKGKINHLKVFVFNFYLQSISSLTSFLTKIEIRLKYRKISTMMFLSIKKCLLYPFRITMEILLWVILGFTEILTGF